MYYGAVKRSSRSGVKRGSRLMFEAQRVELKVSPSRSLPNAPAVQSTAGEQKMQMTQKMQQKKDAWQPEPAAIPTFKETLFKWLDGVYAGFGEKFTELFIAEEFEDMNDIILLESEEDLKDIGIDKKVHRKRILKSIKNYVPPNSTIKSYNGIKYDVDENLGHGALNTTVYKGTYSGGIFKDQPAAIKRVIRSLVTVVEDEINALRTKGVDAHKNIVRLFGHEQDVEFHYLVLELCSADLGHFLAVRQHSFGLCNHLCNNLVDDHDVLYRDMHDCAAAMLGLVEGLTFAHDKNILHRDLKPQNILLVQKRTQAYVEFDPVNRPEQLKWTYWSLKIGDWGLSRVTQGNQSFPSMASLGRSSTNPQASSHGSHNVIGSMGFMAPEEFDPNKKTGKRGSYPGDVFALGIIMYMSLTNGEHPFSTGVAGQLDIPRNILYGHKDLGNDSKLHIAGAFDLIRRCLEPIPTNRPRAKKMQMHPFFWQPEKWVNFTSKFWNTLKKSTTDVKNMFRTSDVEILGKDWQTKVLECKFQCELPRVGTTFTCLQFIRNEHQHNKTIRSDRDYWFLIFNLFSKLPGELFSWAWEGRNCGKRRFPGFRTDLAEHLQFFDTREISQESGGKKKKKRKKRKKDKQ